MNFEEYAAKPVLAAAGIATPSGELATAGDAVGAIAARLGGGCVVKAQVPTGKRGKAGGIKVAGSVAEAAAHAEAILGMAIGNHTVSAVLVESQVDIAKELYAAVLNDSETKGPLVMFSTEGGMDIEAVAEASPEKLRRHLVDIRKGFGMADAQAMLSGLDVNDADVQVAETLTKLYAAYIANDAETLEINPLVVTGGGDVIALD